MNFDGEKLDSDTWRDSVTPDAGLQHGEYSPMPSFPVGSSSAFAGLDVFEYKGEESNDDLARLLDMQPGDVIVRAEPPMLVRAAQWRAFVDSILDTST